MKQRAVFLCHGIACAFAYLVSAQAVTAQEQEQIDPAYLNSQPSGMPQTTQAPDSTEPQPQGINPSDPPATDAVIRTQGIKVKIFDAAQIDGDIVTAELVSTLSDGTTRTTPIALPNGGGLTLLSSTQETTLPPFPDGVTRLVLRAQNLGTLIPNTPGIQLVDDSQYFSRAGGPFFTALLPVGGTLSVSFKFPQIEVSRSSFPESACHIEQAWRGYAVEGNAPYNIGKQQPRLLTYIGDNPDPNPPADSPEIQARAATPPQTWNKNARRARSNGRTQLPDGSRNYTGVRGERDGRGLRYSYDLDEYPGAAFRENKGTANIKRINAVDNQDSGSNWGTQVVSNLRANVGDIVEFVTTETYLNGFRCNP